MFLHNCGLFDNSFLLNYQKNKLSNVCLVINVLSQTASGGKNKIRACQLIGSLLVDHAIFAD